LNILGAEIMTRFDGIILDTFFVTDARTGQLANREEREKFELLVQKILTGAPLDLPALIGKVRPAPGIYTSLEGERIPTVVEIDNGTSDTRTIVDLQAEDRLGLLYDVSRVLTELEVNIHLAKILTENGAAIDTFYIAERDGSKVLDPERQKAIKQRLRQAAQNGLGHGGPDWPSPPPRPTLIGLRQRSGDFRLHAGNGRPITEGGRRHGRGGGDDVPEDVWIFVGAGVLGVNDFDGSQRVSVGKMENEAGVIAALHDRPPGFFAKNLNLRPLMPVEKIAHVSAGQSQGHAYEPNRSFIHHHKDDTIGR
jgi:hypothetical protein